MTHVGTGAVAEHQGGDGLRRAHPKCADFGERPGRNADAQVALFRHAFRRDERYAASSSTDWMIRPTRPYSTDSSALIQ